jgi:hypothetical protein
VSGQSESVVLSGKSNPWNLARTNRGAILVQVTKIHVGYEIVSTFSLALSFGAAKERVLQQYRNR